jgi:PleD family two-component response regulator
MKQKPEVFDFEEEILDLEARATVLAKGAEPYFSQPYTPNPQTLEKAKAVIEHLSRDDITQLHVRSVFRENVAAMLAKAYRKHAQVAYLIADIDYFKRVNDTYGHAEGDRALAHFAKVLRENVRTIPTNPAHERRKGPTDGEKDLVDRLYEETVEIGRVGGEEFGIALYGANALQALKISNRLHNALQANPYVTAKGDKIYLTMSIGISTTSVAEAAKPATFEELHQGADQALYRAKHNGRNCTKLSSQDFDLLALQYRAGCGYISAGHHSPKTAYDQGAA